MKAAWSCALCEATLAGIAVTRAKSSYLICSWCEDDLAARGLNFCRRCHRTYPRDAVKQQRCPVCRKMHRRMQYLKNREQELARAAAYQQTHAETRAAYKREQRRRTRDRVNARDRARYWRRREHITALHRASYARHVEKRRMTKRAYRLRHLEAHRVNDRRYHLRKKLAALRDIRRAVAGD